ncbi:MAG: rir1 [Gammaproteobacteria bacterium]|jgi:ribonucleoside-diphosphate reductase alpha chain|nr:rir1 [Gammaproteobacteria bacterium]
MSASVESQAGSLKSQINPAMMNQQSELKSNTPGTLRVIKRNGKVVTFDASKIAIAMTKAFLAVEGGQAASSSRVHEVVDKLSQAISDAFNRRLPAGGTIHIEDIQDQVELMLMREGEHKIARSYVLYREARRQERAAAQTTDFEITASDLSVTLRDGNKAPLDTARLGQIISEACRNLSNVTAEQIYKETLRNIFDGIPVSDVAKAAQLSARALIETDPNYSFVAARLLLDDLRGEALRFLELQEDATFDEMAAIYPAYLKAYVMKGIEHELLDPELAKFDLEKLGAAIKPERDLKFTYLGLQTLYDRYFIHHRGTRFELPQAFFMRVAMGLALNEKDKEAATIEFYEVLSSFTFMSSTPTLFNSGTLRPQLSSCFLTTIPDDLDGIYSAIKDNALLSKYAGGLGNDWTPVRAMNSYIKGTNGKSQGVVPFMNVANASAVAVNQGGKRKGAICGYLETWHLDIEEFLELRKNTGDERRRTHDMNTANWIPDLFMKRVFENGEWTLFSPSDVPHLHDLYGAEFEKAYAEAEEEAARGEIKLFKKIPAVSLWRKMLSMLFETGHPWVTFKDPCNVRSPQQHCGVVHSSNLCTEITLNTSHDEVAVCNLGSINMPEMMGDKGLDVERLRHTVRTAIRMLDNVIDINYYCIPQAKNSNMKHRPIGLGIMGFQDALYHQGIAYSSDAAVEFADRSMEYLSYFAIEASSDLAAERGSYESFKGSLWSRGILPIDSIKLLKETRGQYLDQDTSTTLDWDALREKVKKQGIRNSNTMAIAPTATISNICGVSQSIEPTYQNLFVKSNMSGEFTVVNPYLVRDLKALNLWDEVMVNDLKYYNGSLKPIQRIPEKLKTLYATAFEVEPKWLIDSASRRQKWIDQAQSLNLYMAEPSGKKLDILYRMAWVRGLKTTYYLRSMGATNAEKSTIHDGALNAVKNVSAAPVEAAPKACSINDPDCEACQ